ncbi:BQ5605_C002g01608 [Microbotryum silenes-dioicae]|uniref:BQ5605_C002g01608 protein n=1 Tax=Microbotryum silenes-dioicae TaxID=796604 RepID=A0A2X0P214_9BASI|nr:BQ5605_C002g01608 [Microbotryum silenes-dioicae]
MTFSATTRTPHEVETDANDPWAIQPARPPSPPPPAPTQEELIELKRRERLEKKQQKTLQLQAAKAATLEATKLNGASTTMRFKPRPWLRREPSTNGQAGQRRTFTLFSWNMLAQALVRRELFPGSDFLKVKTRIMTLMAEVLHYSPSLVCLQEVDHYDTHRQALEQAGYDLTYHIGYDTKPHGVLIAHQASLFDKVDQLEINFDEEKMRASLATTSVQLDRENLAEERRIRALSRSTRNVALFVALKHKPLSDSSSLSSEGGLIIGTTHLFWHPTHVYERVRQMYLFAERAERFRVEMQGKHGGLWRLILAGDLNTQPNEITYALLKRVPLTPSQTHAFEASCVIHQSVDKIYNPSYETMNDVKEVAEGEEATEDPDKVIKNSRAANEADGLVSLDEFKPLYESLPHVRSAYGEIHGLFTEEQAQWYVERPPDVESSQGWKIIEDPRAVEQRRQGSWEERVARGDFEPMYTNYTPLWRCCLDYILALEKEDRGVSGVEWTGLMRMHRRDEMGDGLPKLGVEPSDHLAVACEFVLPL